MFKFAVGVLIRLSRAAYVTRFACLFPWRGVGSVQSKSKMPTIPYHTHCRTDGSQAAPKVRRPVWAT